MVTMGISLIFISRLEKIGNYRYFQGQVGAGLIFYLATTALIFFFGEERMPAFFWIFFNVMAYAIFTLLNSTFWNYLDYHYNMQDAKRLFSLFNSATFLGMTTAGAVLSWGLLSSSAFLFLIFLTLLLSGLIIYYTFHNLPRIDTSNENGKEEALPSLKESLSAILSSGFAFFLVLSNFMIESLTYLCEFKFQTDFEHYFRLGGLEAHASSMTNDYSIFIGKLTAIVAFSNLIFSLFGFSRAINRFGVQNTLLTIPILFFSVFLGWLTLPMNLAVPILGFVIVEGAMYSIDYNNFNLVINGVPFRHKGVIRYIIESFFEPFSLFVAGSLLYFFSPWATLISLLISMTLLGSKLYLRSAYPYALLQNLMDSSFNHFKTFSNLWQSLRKGEKEENLASLKEGLLKTGTERSYSSAKLLLKIGGKEAQLVLTHFYSLKNSKEKSEILNLIADSPISESKELVDYLIHFLTEQTSDEFLSHAAFYLSLIGKLPQKAIVFSPNSDNPYLVGASIVEFWREKQRACEQALDRLLDSASNIQRAIGLKVLGLSPFHSYKETLIRHLAHDDIIPARQAALSLSKHTTQKDRHLLWKLTDLALKIEDLETEKALLKAVCQIASPEDLPKIMRSLIHLERGQLAFFESQILDNLEKRSMTPLKQIMLNPEEDNKTRLASTRMLTRLAKQEADPLVYELIEKETEKAWFYFYHAYALPWKEEKRIDYRFKEALLTGYQTTLNFIIQLLGAGGLVESGEILAYTLLNGNEKIQGQALETLEKFCPKKIYNLIYPFFGFAKKETMLLYFEKLGYKAFDFKELILLLKNSSSKLDRYFAERMLNER